MDQDGEVEAAKEEEAVEKTPKGDVDKREASGNFKSGEWLEETEGGGDKERVCKIGGEDCSEGSDDCRGGM